MTEHSPSSDFTKLKEDSPMESASMFSILTYSWMNDLLRRGSKKSLDFDDIYPLPRIYQSQNVYERISIAWKEEIVSATSKNRIPKLSNALFSAFSHTIVFSVAAMIPYIVSSVLQPLFVQHFIEYATTQQTYFLGIRNGFGLVFLLCSISTISILSFNHSFYHTSRLGIFCRSSAMALTFVKSMKLSSASKGKHTTGEIVNLLNVDSERLWQAVLFANWLWVGPVLVITSMSLLIEQVGYSVIAAVCVLFTINFIQARIGKNIGETRRRLVKLTDERVKVMNEVLQGMRIIKFYAWEEAISNRIELLRKKEVEALKQYHIGRMMNTVLTFIGPLTVTFSLFMCYVLTGGALTVAKVYTVYSLLNLLRLPFQLTPQAYTALLEGFVSIDRLSKFLLLEEVDELPKLEYDDTLEGKSEYNESDTPIVKMKNAYFSWEFNSDSRVRNEKTSVDNAVTPCLKNISLEIFPGEFIAVVGPVGAGKTSLLSAILGEMYRVSGDQFLYLHNMNQPIPYVGQEHWIQNLKLLDNILLNDKYDEATYIHVLNSSQLTNDLLSLPDADYTYIGERGINLSGGQKARVNIARALYKSQNSGAPSARNLYLIDDSLASVDIHVGKALFNQAFNNNGILKGKTRIIVLSSNYHLLSQFDKIIVMENGEIKMVGEYSEVIKVFPVYALAEDESRQQAPESAIVDDIIESDSEPSVYHKIKDLINAKRDKFTAATAISASSGGMTEEDRERGAVRLSTYFNYFKATTNNSSGVFLFIFVLFVFIIGQTLRTVCDIWVGLWAADVSAETSQSINYYYLQGYIVIVVLTVTVAIWRSYNFVLLCIQASKNLHSNILLTIFRASINMYYDITPVGRILNRFSRDLDSIDSLLPDFFLQNVQNLLQVLFILIVCLFISAYFVLLLIPIVTLFYYFQNYFRNSSRELKRLDSISRSPIYSHFSEALNGLSTIRAYNQSQTFVQKFFELSDAQNRNFFAFWMASRWLALRLDFIGVCIIFAVCILTVGLASTQAINPNYLGLALTYSFQLTGLLQWTVRVTIETETNMTSVERLMMFTTVPSESTLGLDIATSLSTVTSRNEHDNAVNSDSDVKMRKDEQNNNKNKSKLISNEDNAHSRLWPSEGEICISNLSLRYRPGLDLVLKGLNLVIKGGSKLGVVGRTAAGKSSLMLALFRIVEPEVGSVITIDGVDTLSMKLTQLRRNLTIIPQDPYMLSGTLRVNLDPFCEHSDEELWEALEYSHLKDDVVNKFPEKLEYMIAERGDNISSGQKQLICIARALLRKPKILILDEATASIDSATDSKIQDSIRKHFKSCTVLTIAHRLETIADYDNVLVMSYGTVAEFGPPKTLLENAEGMFRSLVDELGPERRENFIRLTQNSNSTHCRL